MPQIFGHQQALKTLCDAHQGQRFHHAWIISGPLGVGKCTLAKEVARVLLEECGDMTALLENANGDSHGVCEDNEPTYHQDMHVIHRSLAAHSSNPQLRDRKQINIPIDLLRETMIGGRTSDNRVHEAKAYLTSSLGGAKVFIVDEAERLDLAGQNALLKTLEEPPSKTYFFLVTAQPERLLPTIVSRCQHLRLSPLGNDEMVGWSRSRGLNREDVDVSRAIEFAEGAPGIALLAIERSMTPWIESIQSIMGDLYDGQWTNEASTKCVEFVDMWVEAIVSDNPKASKDGANRDGIEMLMRIMTFYIRQRMRVTKSRSEMVYWCQLVDRLTEAESHIAASLNLKHVLEALMVEWREPAVR